jgi:putative transposase
VEVAELEHQLNKALAKSLPKGLVKRPLEVAVDLKLVPYYGDPHEGEEEFLLKSKPKQGTSTFFGYASLYVIKRNRRYTLAVVAVRRGEGLADVLRLWGYWLKLGLFLGCLYLDREFPSEVLRWLWKEDLPLRWRCPRKGGLGSTG